MNVGPSSPKQAYLCEGGSKFDGENGQQQAGGLQIRRKERGALATLATAAVPVGGLEAAAAAAMAAVAAPAAAVLAGGSPSGASSGRR
jgi:hypothetical protein